jgi:hypothetical protein
VRALDCREWIDEAVECARRGAAPSEHLGAHLAQCPSCRERWEAEQSLGPAMRNLRLALAHERSPRARGRQLLAEFDRLRRPPRRFRYRWAWGAVAAALLIAAFLQVRQETPGPNPVPAQQLRGDAVASADIDDEGGFIPVPYTPPLAAGESVRIVRQELNGAELARMGIDVPGGYGDDFDADVVLGGDGMPRAVHLVGYEEL